MLLPGVFGFYLGDLWHWLGTFAFVFVVLLDVALPQDDKSRYVEPLGLRDVVLYLQWPFIFTLELMFAQMLNAGGRCGVENGFDSPHVFIHKDNSVMLENKTVVPLGSLPTVVKKVRWLRR